MKKTHFIIITAIASVAAFSCPYAAGEKHDIPVQKVIPNTRSIANIPKASIDTQTCILDISFDRSGMYVLSIEDSFGATIYSSTLPADGMEYSYDLSGIGEGTFTLTLEGPSGKYEGIFWIQ